MNEPRKRKSRLRLKVEDLEERIAPTLLGGTPGTDGVDNIAVDSTNHTVSINDGGPNNGTPPPEVVVNDDLVTPEP